jgi:hypothetical protein
MQCPQSGTARAKVIPVQTNTRPIWKGATKKACSVGRQPRIVDHRVTPRVDLERAMHWRSEPTLRGASLPGIKLPRPDLLPSRFSKMNCWSATEANEAQRLCVALAGDIAPSRIRYLPPRTQLHRADRPQEERDGKPECGVRRRIGSSVRPASQFSCCFKLRMC